MYGDIFEVAYVSYYEPLVALISICSDAFGGRVHTPGITCVPINESILCLSVCLYPIE